MALVILVVLLVFAGPIVRAFIDDAATVSYGQTFLRILTLASPVTAINIMVITIFQATGLNAKATFISLVRKGADIPLMFLLDHAFGISGLPWAVPAADFLAAIFAISWFLPYHKKIATQEKKI